MLRGFDIAWDTDKIVWDQHNPHPELEQSAPEIVFISKGSGAAAPFNQDEEITRGLQEVVAIFGGYVQPARLDSKLSFAPLLRSGTLSGTLAKSRAFTFSPFGQRLDPNRRYFRDGTEKVMACRVTGKKTGDVKKDINLIFVADLDMVGSMFFEIRRRGFGDSKIAFDNVTFILNCVDELAGDRSFIELRKRRPLQRTLTRLERQQQRFNQEWLVEKSRAEEKAGSELKKAQGRLDDRVAAVEKNTELDERSKKIQIETIREVEQRRLDLAKAKIEDAKMEAIEQAKAKKLAHQNEIQAWYKTTTLGGTPIPALLVALLVFLRRRKRERRIVPGRRYAGGGAK